MIFVSLKQTQASWGYSLRPWSEIVEHSLKSDGAGVQAQWTCDSWRCRRVAGDSFVIFTASPHLSLFALSQALAAPWGHRPCLRRIHRPDGTDETGTM